MPLKSIEDRIQLKLLLKLTLCVFNNDVTIWLKTYYFSLI